MRAIVNTLIDVIWDGKGSGKKSLTFVVKRLRIVPANGIMNFAAFFRGKYL